MGSRRMVAKIGDGSAETPAKPDPRGNEPNTDYENLQFFFHSDHLGSTSYMTDLSGEVSQHVEYFPYGGIMIEERNNAVSEGNTPYLFNGKELDLETGLYYYGARYSDSDGSIFLSIDRFAERFPWQSGYTYAGNNPINYIDVNGDSTVINNKGGIVFTNDRNGEGDGKVYSQIDDKLNPIGEIGGEINLDGIMENILKSNSEKAKGINSLIKGENSFANNVKKHSDWDFKNNKETIFGLAWELDNKTAFSFGKYKGMTASDVGNYHYGYIGRFTYEGKGISPFRLMFGAGAAEVLKNVGSMFKGNFSGAKYLLPWNNVMGDREKDAIWNIQGIMDANKKKK